MKEALNDALESAGARLVFDKGEDDGQPIDSSTLNYLCGFLGSCIRHYQEEEEKKAKAPAPEA